MIENWSSLEIESFHLEARQWTEFMAPGPPPEEIGMSAAKLPGTGSGQEKLATSVLDEPVHFVEERRDLLHLVDHGEATVESLAQQRRTDRVLGKDICLDWDSEYDYLSLISPGRCPSCRTMVAPGRAMCGRPQKPAASLPLSRFSKLFQSPSHGFLVEGEERLRFR